MTRTSQRWPRGSRAVRAGAMGIAMAAAMACCPLPPVMGDDAAQPAIATRRSTTPAEPNERLELAWLPDESHLLVGRRWLLSLRDERFVPLRCAPNAPRDDCMVKDIAFSPDGEQILLLDRTSFVAGPRQNLPSARTRIPRWVQAPNSDPANGDLVNLAFWLSANRVFVQQFDPANPFAPECRLFDTRTRAWQRPRGGCLAGDFGYLFQVHPGPDGWLLLSSSSEGYRALGLVRYDPAVGQSDPGIPPLLLEAPGPVNVQFARDGSRVALISPCVLTGEKPPPCGDGTPSSSWRLYAWPTTGGAIDLLRADLPPGSALDPTGERFAWPQQNSICIGDPHHAEARCMPLPSSR